MIAKVSANQPATTTVIAVETRKACGGMTRSRVAHGRLLTGGRRTGSATSSAGPADALADVDGRSRSTAAARSRLAVTVSFMLPSSVRVTAWASGDRANLAGGVVRGHHPAHQQRGGHGGQRGDAHQVQLLEFAHGLSPSSRLGTRRVRSTCRQIKEAQGGPEAESDEMRKRGGETPPRGVCGTGRPGKSGNCPPRLSRGCLVPRVLHQLRGEGAGDHADGGGGQARLSAAGSSASAKNFSQIPHTARPDERRDERPLRGGAVPVDAAHERARRRPPASPCRRSAPSRTWCWCC